MQEEIERLLSFYTQLGLDIRLQTGISDASIAAFERETNVGLDNDLKEVFRITNGRSQDLINGTDRITWFGIGDDQSDMQEVVPLALCDLDEALFAWRIQNSEYDDSGSDDENETGDETSMDRRVLSGLTNKSWILIAELIGGHECVYFDGDPGEAGICGQIILSRFFAESVEWYARTFADFFKRSNDLFESFIKDDPEMFRAIADAGRRWLIQ